MKKKFALKIDFVYDVVEDFVNRNKKFSMFVIAGTKVKELTNCTRDFTGTCLNIGKALLFNSEKEAFKFGNKWFEKCDGAINFEVIAA